MSSSTSLSSLLPRYTALREIGLAIMPASSLNTPPLVITDLDGTLLDYRTRSVPAGFGAVLDRVLAAGATFAVASGRIPESVRSLFPDHADRIWIIADNGARLSQAGRTVASMLAACGRSYAMAGGHPAAIAAARFLAPPCEERGEMTVLNGMFP